jgi:branched-chain amino acid transport system substrate-binding protein
MHLPFRAPDTKDKVKIVSSLPRVGATKWQTDQIVSAIQMALADFEKTVPFAVQYLDWDDATNKRGQWDPESEKENAENAGADKDVMAVIGPYDSGAARVSSPILNRAGLVQITPAASYPGLTKSGPFSDPDEPDRYRPGKKITFCRTCPQDGSQGPVAADFVAEELNAKSVYVLDDKGLYAFATATTFKKRCAERKINVLGHESINPLQGDFKKLMKKIKEKMPDLVYFGGTGLTGGPQLAKDMLAEKVGCPLMASEGCYETSFIDAAGKDTFDELKCFVVVGGMNPTQLKGPGAEFIKRFKEKSGKNATAATVSAYEATAVVLEALRVVGKKDREAVRKAVVGTKDFDKGLVGKWSFDADGDTTFQPLTVATIEKGKFRAVKVMGTK